MRRRNKMSVNYTWEIISLKTKNEVIGDGVVLPNAVCQTYWRKTGTDANGVVGEFDGATPFSAANLTPESFQQFDMLTQDIVLGWVKSLVVGDYEEHVNEQIQLRIDEVATGETEAELPWFLGGV
tara:strand:+ start:1608 stop:1982 length:375 start_codon:yes stop_codon:yes gene_type:complete